MTRPLIRNNEDGTVDVTLGVPGVNDRVLAEIRGVAIATGLQFTEALALLIGFGHATAIELGVVRGRSLEPMSRRELLESVRAMLEEEPE